MILIAIDPGRMTGLAFFESGRLVQARLLKDPLSCPSLGKADLVVLEIPTMYPYSGIDPQTMVTLAIRGGFVAGRVIAPQLKLVQPREWKGQRPKEVDNRYTLRLLCDHERRIVMRSTTKAQRHNVIDAVGLGLWALGRR